MILLAGVITLVDDEVTVIDGTANPSSWTAAGLINLANNNERVFWVSSNFVLIFATSDRISSQTLF